MPCNSPERDVAQRYSIRSWCGGSSDWSFMGWTHWAISRSSQCSTTGVTKAVICVILSVGCFFFFFYLTTHSTHFIYGYMASDIWLRTILIVREETRCRHIGYSFRLAARVLLYAPSHRQDSTYHGLCYTSRGALAGTRNSSMGPPHEGSIRRPIAPWANALSYVPLPSVGWCI